MYIAYGTINAFNDDVNLEEGIEDFKEYNIPNFVEDVNNMIAGVIVSVITSNPCNSSKRKGHQHCFQ